MREILKKYLPLCRSGLNILPDAYALLDRLTANRMPQKTGSFALTHMANRGGRIELETTIVRMAQDQFNLVCAAFFEQRPLDHLEQQRVREDATVKVLSEDWSALSLNGPKSRDVLAACTDADQSNAGIRWLSAQKITVAGHETWAFRMSSPVSWVGNSTCQIARVWTYILHFGPQAKGMALPVTAHLR